MKRVLRVIGCILLVLVLAVVAVIGYLTLTEYRPEAQETAAVSGEETRVLDPSKTVKVLSWNTGYAGLDDGVDFFMDGGTMVNPSGEEVIRENMQAIADVIADTDADIYLLQEVDRNCSRTKGIDELQWYGEETGLSWTYGVNYRCKYVPYPWPPMGRMETGVATLSDLQTTADAVRVSLPCPFSWPVRVANIKRCLVVNRYALEGTEKELVCVDLHLEAYDNGEGKLLQTQMLMDLLQEEYEKGNYVIAGGDFNQSFPGTLEQYPIKDGESWAPGQLSESEMTDGWQYAFDASTPTCRLLNQPFDPESEKTQYYVIDGFILSPNVKLQNVQTLDLQFSNSDHNPVQLQVELEQN